MFNHPRSEIAEAAKRIQKYHCAYGGGSFCDCKYGADNINSGQDEKGNGCPEMRTILALLRRITDDEYKEIMARDG